MTQLLCSRRPLGTRSLFTNCQPFPSGYRAWPANQRLCPWQGCIRESCLWGLVSHPYISKRFYLGADIWFQPIEIVIALPVRLSCSSQSLVGLNARCEISEHPLSSVVRNSRLFPMMSAAMGNQAIGIALWKSGVTFSSCPETSIGLNRFLAFASDSKLSFGLKISQMATIS